MLTRKLSGLILAVVIGLTGFATPALTANIPEVKPDKGLVVFYRISRMKGAALRFEIIDTAKGSIGFLSNGTIIHRDLEPGTHTFTVGAPSLDGVDTMSLNVSAGQTFYVKGEILWGWPAGRPKFTLMSEEQAKADLAGFN